MGYNNNRDVFETIKDCVRTRDAVEHYCNVQVPHSGMICCPFDDHNEKTPSFKVYPDRSGFYCFGCHKGGDVITFVRILFNLESNFDAANKLIDDFNLPCKFAARNDYLKAYREYKDKLSSEMKKGEKIDFRRILEESNNFKNDERVKKHINKIHEKAGDAVTKEFYDDVLKFVVECEEFLKTNPSERAETLLRQAKLILKGLERYGFEFAKKPEIRKFRRTIRVVTF